MPVGNPYPGVVLVVCLLEVEDMLHLEREGAAFLELMCGSVGLVEYSLSEACQLGCELKQELVSRRCRSFVSG
jgi:hypothetical protein